MLRVLLLGGIIAVSAGAVAPGAAPVTPSGFDATALLRGTYRVRAGRDSAGSAVAIDAHHVLTCAHVTDGRQALLFTYDDDGATRPIKATLIRRDTRLDMAEYETSVSLPATDAVATDAPVRGETVYAAGFPLDLGEAITSGFAGGPHIGLAGVPSYQMSVAIWPGNSGGPVFGFHNGAWRVLGLVSSVYTAPIRDTSPHFVGDYLTSTVSFMVPMVNLPRFLAEPRLPTGAGAPVQLTPGDKI